MAAVIGWRRKWVAGGDEIVNGHTMLDDRGALGATDDSQRRKQQSAIYLLHGGSGGGQGLAKRAPRGIDWRLVTKAGVRGRGEDGPIATVRCRCGGRGEGEGDDATRRRRQWRGRRAVVAQRRGRDDRAGGRGEWGTMTTVVVGGPPPPPHCDWTRQGGGVFLFAAA